MLFSSDLGSCFRSVTEEKEQFEKEKEKLANRLRVGFVSSVVLGYLIKSVTCIVKIKFSFLIT